MGLLDRTLGFLNRAGGTLDAADDIVDGRAKRAARTLAEGETASARITGIERRLQNGTDENVLALAVLAGTAEEHHAVRVTGAPLQRLRLGLPVLARVRDDHAVLDWPAMCDAWGHAGSEPAQRHMRQAPEDGVVDKALDGSVRRRLKQWTPARATITGVDQVFTLGMPTENFDVTLQVAGGATALAKRDRVPFYAAWLAAPGTEVPVVVDPDDPTRAAVDWPAAANEAADRAGALEDAPPPGSVAETLLSITADPEPAAAAPAAPLDLSPADGAVAPIEGVTLETWAAVEAGLGRDRVKPADHDAYAQRHGVPAGRWSAVDAAWKSRMMSDWRVGAHMGEALEAAKRRR